MSRVSSSVDDDGDDDYEDDDNDEDDDDDDSNRKCVTNLFWPPWELLPFYWYKAYNVNSFFCNCQ